ncbi:MAG: 50S ribosomal protein L18 [Bacteroidetes bacterium]|jgi:large subunit ribosomal protein L18|nr:50S ribosomal protein L18 [Bacteroidota bacterium]MCL5034020.1 50S ribosomal protein L18 [Bacteroidota bacterium]
MGRLETKRTRHDRAKRGLRKKIKGTVERPRLVVFRSLKHIYGTIIDDIQGKTILQVSSLNKEIADELKAAKGKTNVSKIVGKALAKKALENNIQQVVFDRGGFLYHGRLKAFAEGAREGGLKF